MALAKVRRSLRFLASWCGELKAFHRKGGRAAMRLRGRGALSADTPEAEREGRFDKTAADRRIPKLLIP